MTNLINFRACRSSACLKKVKLGCFYSTSTFRRNFLFAHSQESASYNNLISRRSTLLSRHLNPIDWIAGTSALWLQDCIERKPENINQTRLHFSMKPARNFVSCLQSIRGIGAQGICVLQFSSYLFSGCTEIPKILQGLRATSRQVAADSLLSETRGWIIPQSRFIAVVFSPKMILMLWPGFYKKLKGFPNKR